MLPQLSLVLVGSANIPASTGALQEDPAVTITGRVDDVQPYYYGSSVCIAPLLSGSGTRLKILEAMSFGNPVVSTGIGAEGIDAQAGRHILIGDDPQSFAENIRLLLTDKALYGNIQKAGRALVEAKYDWEKLGYDMNGAIAHLNIQQDGQPG